MSSTSPTAPRFTTAEAVTLAARFGVRGTAGPLPSYQDQNFRIHAGDAGEFVLKISSSCVSRAELELQNAALDHLAASDWHGDCPRVVRTEEGEDILRADSPAGAAFDMRLLTWVDGELLAEEPPRMDLRASLGNFLAGLDEALADFDHPAAHRALAWDLARASSIANLLPAITHPERRAIARRFRASYETRTEPRLARLRASVIHGDANDYNLLVSDGAAGKHVTGIIDFGDLLHTARISEVAIAAAYAVLGAFDPLQAAGEVVRGYHARSPLEADELAVLFPMIAMRLATSVAMAAHSRAADPDNEYISIHEAPAWRALEQLACVDAEYASRHFHAICGLGELPGHDQGSLLAERERLLGKALSLSYSAPLEIVRGSGAWLFDSRGRAFLDCVNNVCHVGHAHPHVVRAAQEQIATLNTNTRYLHPSIVEFARRLTGTLPDSLSVCYFVCTGSEANDLALRMARAHTGRRGVVVIDGAYHGNTSSLIDLSPYKFDGPGGAGRPRNVHVATMPDPYRGEFGHDDPDAGAKYAQHVAAAFAEAEAQGSPAAAFFAESLLGCGGQVVPPPGYLISAFDHARAAGGVCIADEVQIGFGRVGSHFWGFESQGGIPDIVTMGKPIGNGHPLAAVVTTPEIAASFAGGMEYFNTFGGNPVSCAVGLAVLDVIEAEGLQENARNVGEHLQRGLEELARRHPCIAEVRGLGLFLGIELVSDAAARTPDAELAAAVTERLCERGVLLSTDGPLHNVLKIKPPIVFTEEDADRVVSELDRAFAELR